MAFKFPSFAHFRPKKPSIFEGFPTQFSWDNIADLDEIGRGSFGCVFTAKRRDGEIVVVKELLRQHERETRLFVKEARILNSLHHKHIVELKAVCEKREQILGSLKRRPS